MRKFLGTRIGVILITALVCVVAFGGIAYASGTFIKDVPITGKVLATSPDLGIYADAACTTPLTTVTFADVGGGETLDKQIWIKNIGNKDFIGLNFSSNIDPTLATITATGFPPSLGKNLSCGVVLHITGANIPVDTTFNTYNVVFECSY